MKRPPGRSRDTETASRCLVFDSYPQTTDSPLHTAGTQCDLVVHGILRTPARKIWGWRDYLSMRLQGCDKAVGAWHQSWSYSVFSSRYSLLPLYLVRITLALPFSGYTCACSLWESLNDLHTGQAEQHKANLLHMHITAYCKVRAAFPPQASLLSARICAMVLYSKPIPSIIHSKQSKRVHGVEPAWLLCRVR